MNISVYTDCGDNTVTLRIPFEMLEDILKYLPDSPQKQELITWTRISSSRSKKLRGIINKYGFE